MAIPASRITSTRRRARRRGTRRPTRVSLNCPVSRDAPSKEDAPSKDRAASQTRRARHRERGKTSRRRQKTRQKTNAGGTWTTPARGAVRTRRSACGFGAARFPRFSRSSTATRTTRASIAKAREVRRARRPWRGSWGTTVRARRRRSGIAAHPRATAAQVERAVAALVAARVSSRDINRDDDVSDPHDPHDPRDPHVPFRPWSAANANDARKRRRAAPVWNLVPLRARRRDPARRIRPDGSRARGGKAVFRAGTEPAQSATLNRVVGRLSACRHAVDRARPSWAADRRAGTWLSSRRAVKVPRTKAGPVPRRVAAFKERKRRKRNAWLDT